MTTDQQPVLVLGATGGQGGAVVRALQAKGAPVRALVRDPHSSSATRLEREGIEVVAGFLDDTASLATAMQGTRSVFALTTPFEAGTDAEMIQGRAILTAADKAQVPHLVFSSVAGAHGDSGVPHFESKAVIESELTGSDMPYTILAPTYFFDNALGGEQHIRDGVLQLPLPPDQQLQQLARADLGRYAAAVLLDPVPFAGQRIELAGDSLTPAQMAETLTRALGRPVRHDEVALGSIGSSDMKAMWKFLQHTGYQVNLPRLHANPPHLPWTSFRDWAANAFRHKLRA
ncbi:NmrA/HSCARG family protein [Kocuria rosea]|uniref:NmrA/HSCARG family protein n=1 Tax=Kocuria rosea TaxID=1275 RepID=UPI00203BFC12|nr:NmrA/HSCARG family protein [Kocuria rosea]MCM3688694.1 NmrA/HSCARG family protein [Kocuria rosea]